MCVFFFFHIFAFLFTTYAVYVCIISLLYLLLIHRIFHSISTVSLDYTFSLLNLKIRLFCVCCFSSSLFLSSIWCRVSRVCCCSIYVLMLVGLSHFNFALVAVRYLLNFWFRVHHIQKKNNNIEWISNYNNLVVSFCFSLLNSFEDDVLHEWCKTSLVEFVFCSRKSQSIKI